MKFGSDCSGLFTCYIKRDSVKFFVETDPSFTFRNISNSKYCLVYIIFSKLLRRENHSYPLEKRNPIGAEYQH